MAFKPVSKAINLKLPCRIESAYLVPYAWMAYGLENKFLTIQDNGFYTSLQGSAYCQAINLNLSFEYWEGDKCADIWLQVKDGMMRPVKVWNDYFNPDEYCYSQYLKMNVYPVTTYGISYLNPYNQMTVNNSIIQLLKGCHVRLNNAFWGDEYYHFPETSTAKNQVTRNAIWQFED